MISYGEKFPSVLCIIVVYVVGKVMDLLKLRGVTCMCMAGLKKFSWISILVLVQNGNIIPIHVVVFLSNILITTELRFSRYQHIAQEHRNIYIFPWKSSKFLINVLMTATCCAPISGLDVCLYSKLPAPT